MPKWLNISDITCRYDAKPVFSKLSFSVSEGHIGCLLGPSGCGKTTALRAIAGFEDIHSGSITLAGHVISQPGASVPPEKRQIGMVFQDYALFPHLSVRDNIAFGLQKLPKTARSERTNQLLDLIRMQDNADAYPHQLSGGQQQRVALARALAPKPRLILLDEPFSNLDTDLRRSLSVEVRELLQREGTTAILVTHDQGEAFTIADEIGVMNEGRILQWGTPQSLFARPNCPFVASFVAQGQFIPGQLLSSTSAATCFGTVALEPSAVAIADADRIPVSVLLRPWQVVQDNHGPCAARVAGHQFHGAVTVTALTLPDGRQLLSHDEALATHPVNSEVHLALRSGPLRAFPA
jgi:iron(III) transport system ATP-binding protein